jgi:hypothetical protein
VARARDHPPLHVLLMQVPRQQSAVVWQGPPSGEHSDPDDLHWPSWQTPPAQQSESAVHVPLPIGMHVDPHTNAVPPSTVCGTQMWLQHWSQRAQGVPLGKQAAWGGRHRLTPSLVVTQLLLPPEQQFCDAPLPPHTSPSGTQLNPVLLHRRTPSASGAPHSFEQHSKFAVHRSSYVWQPHIG